MHGVQLYSMPCGSIFPEEDQISHFIHYVIASRPLRPKVEVCPVPSSNAHLIIIIIIIIKP
jgi:hypothetical protein